MTHLENFSKNLDLEIKKMKKRLYIHLIIFIILVTAALYFGYILSINANEKQQTFNSLVGKQIIVDKDTLTIIDYNLLHRTFRLSNGIDYEMSYIKQKVK